MTYAYFLMRLEQLLTDALDTGEKVRRVQILKNNSVKLDGFTYGLEGHREQPTVYVNHFFHRDMQEEELLPIAEKILKIQRSSILYPEKDLSQVLVYENMKKHIYYRLISKSANEELLNQIPWIPWMDLAIVFYMRIPEHILEHATALIHTSHMEHWGIAIKELYRVAAENMAELPVQLEPMEIFLEGYGFEPLSSGMHVLSIGRKEFGAAAILNPQILRRCYRKLGEDYYVLPSSVHEVILLPKSLTVSRTGLDELVREVNEKCVSKEEILSDHAYFYDGTLGQLN